MLRPDQWRLAEEKAGSTQVRQTLLDLGFLTAREMQEADRERVTALVLGLFTWREGRYEIAPGPLPHGTPNLKIDPRDLVLEGLISSGDRGRVLDEIGSLDAVLVVRPDDLVRASLSLPVEVVGLMGKADGTRTISDICALSPLSDFLISAAFAGLKVLGLARPVEGGVTAAPPAPPVPEPERPPTRRRANAREAGAHERAPLLPLYDSTDYETMPMAATPPGGVPKTAPHPDAATPASAGDHIGSGTRPIRAGAGREMIADLDPLSRTEGEPMIPVEVAEPAVSIGNGLDPGIEESPDVRVEGVEVTEPDTESPGMESEDAGEEGDRESEVELKPGIRVAPLPPERTASPLLDDEEIETAIQMFDGPAEEEEDLAGEIDEEKVQVEEDLDADHGNIEETEAAAGEPPPWIYQPSEEPVAEARGRKWATWGGLAAAIAGLGFGLVVLFGGARGNPEQASPAPPSVERAPADVVAPAAFESQPPPPSPAPAPAVSTAAMSIPSQPVRSPEPEKYKPAASLAPASQGSILSSGAFKEGRRLLESASYNDAAAKFAIGVSGRKGMYTVQLALACEPSTIARAAGSTRGATQFFILPTTYKGQACYRMLWGAYSSKNAAAGARGGVPSAFLKDPHPPVVAPL